MSYPASFHRLVILGNLYLDTFNVTLSIIPGLSGSLPAVPQTLADSLGAAIGDWWNDALSAGGGGLTISASAIYTGIKLNRINSAGHYQDPDTIQYLAPTPVPGGGGAGGVPQLSLVSSLRGPNPRGRAGKGRMFWPPSLATQTAVDTTGRVAAANAENHAHGVANLLGIVDDAYLAAGINAVAGIASSAGTGAFQAVEVVRVGRVIDTMRSRRNKQLEDYAEVEL